MNVVKVSKKKAFGETKEYVDLVSVDGELSVSIPMSSVEEAGIRFLLDAEELPDLFDVLRKRNIREASVWSRRFKNHQEMLKSGDPYQVAEVVRNLALREQGKGLSAGEKTMQASCRRTLLTELALSAGMPVEQMEKEVDEALKLEKVA